MLGDILLVVLGAISPLAAADPQPAEILTDMRRVVDWQIANPSKHYQVSGEPNYRAVTKVL